MYVSMLIKFQNFIKKTELDICKKLLEDYYYIITLLNNIIPKNPKKMVFFGWPDYTGNSMALYKYMLNNRDYDMTWITVEGTPKSSIVKKFCNIFTYRAICSMLNAGFIFVSNTSSIKLYKILGNKKQKYVNLWHGMPIKALFNLHINENFQESGKKYIRSFIGKKSLFACAPSEYWQCVMCACFLADKEMMPITGQARNDYIIQNHSKSGLNCICDADKYDKIILYAPTYCKHNENCAANDFRLIQVPNFDIESFNNYLRDNNILLIAKLHPIEEAAYKDFLHDYSNIKMVNYHEMQRNDIELDYILGCFDLLITDYSSIYVDYLLANKPILFLKQNYEEYMDKRGFIMGENYSFFCPGPMISNYDELKKSILTELNDDNYKKEREKIRSLFHKYTDGKACERICKYLNI